MSVRLLSSTVLSPKSTTTRRFPPEAATQDCSVSNSVCDRSAASERSRERDMDSNYERVNAAVPCSPQGGPRPILTILFEQARKRLPFSRRRIGTRHQQ